MTRRWSHWTIDETERLKGVYSHAKTDDIETQFPLHSRGSIYVKARELGLKKGARYSGHRVFEPIWDFWDKWSDDLAYVVGLLAADGTIADTSHQHGIRLALKSSDEYLLRQIASLAGGRVHQHRCAKACNWALSGIDVTKRLGELGITPRKTLRVDVPYIPAEHRGAFVRGYFDGDGTIGEYRVLRGTARRVAFAGNEQFLTSLRAMIAATFPELGSHVMGRPIPKFKNANMWALTFNARPITSELVRWMYKNANLHLVRKKVRAAKWLEPLAEAA